MKIAALLLAALVGSALSQTGPQVTIPGLGTVEGDIANSYVDNRPYYRFRGMPFAAPPIGQYRYKAPGPVEPWSGVFNATQLGQRCAQSSTGFGNDTYEYDSEVRASDDIEDCLYLSVYTPQIGAGVNLPVMVFYHGGAFILGSGFFYEGEKFMDKDVVLVVPHYRLGPLGFLSLETDDIPGNAGMIDQVAALQWTLDHISLFGGDPTKVTVMGESAGGASSSLLNISPLSTGLFQQYIAQSGSAMSFWAIERNPVRVATELGKLINCTGTDLPTLTQCFQTVDAQDLVDANSVLFRNELKEGRYTVGAPTIQKAGAVRFLEREPKEILEEGAYVHKPALVGANKNEGTLVYKVMVDGYLVPNNLVNDTEYMKREFTNFVMEFFGVTDQGETIASGIEKAFIGQENMGNFTAMTSGVVDFGGDMFLKSPVYKDAIYNSMRSPTYLYAFRFLGDGSIVTLPTNIPAGVCHGCELVLLFNVPGIVLKQRDREMSKKMIAMWTNFATFGEPNSVTNPVEGVPIWPLFDGKVGGSYLRLDDNCTISQHYSYSEFFAAVDEGFPWTSM